MADAPWPDFSQHMAEGDNIVQRRIDQFNIAAEQRIDQFNAAAEQGIGQVNKNAEQRIAQINNTLQQTVKKFDTVAEQRIGQIENVAQKQVEQFDETATKTINQVNIAAIHRIDQIENVFETTIGTIYAQIANFFAILEKILSTALFVSKIGMLFMVFLFLYGDLGSLRFVITAALVSAAAVYLEQYLKGDKIILIICTFGAVYVAMCFIMKSSAF